MNKIKIRNYYEADKIVNFSGDWSNPITHRHGFRQPKTSKHYRQKIGKKKV